MERWYIVNGETLHFTNVSLHDGYHYYGFCKKKNSWAWLYDNCLQFEHERTLQRAKMVEKPKKEVLCVGYFSNKGFHPY